MYTNLLSIILMVNLAGWGCTYTMQPIEFEILDDNKFRLSIPNDPDIKWVSFHVNINKDFRSFEEGQLTGVSNIPKNQKWSYEFERAVKDTDIIYVWLAVQVNRLIFRDRKEPISVEAYKNGNPNYSSTDSPIDVKKENKICRPTITEVPKLYGGPYCRDDVIFSDNFENFNSKYWINEIRIPPTINDAEFVLYNGTLGVENGVLKIEASLNAQNLRKDVIELGSRCTSSVYAECYLKPNVVFSLPPIISGRLSTKDNFYFKYGRIEVRAKLPIGDWLFPIISLQPLRSTYGENYKSGEMRIAYAHGNPILKWQNKDYNAGRLFGGVILDKEAELRYNFMKDVTLPNKEFFGEDFHLYSLTWKPDELIMAVDGNEYGRIETHFLELVKEPLWKKGEKNAPLDQMFYITLGLAAGGNGDFPNTEGKPWGNTDPRGNYNFYRNRTWIRSWSQPTLEVDFVRVYAV